MKDIDFPLIAISKVFLIEGYLGVIILSPINILILPNLHIAASI